MENGKECAHLVYALFRYIGGAHFMFWIVENDGRRSSEWRIHIVEGTVDVGPQILKPKTTEGIV